MLGPHCDGAGLTTALASAVASRAQRHKHSLSNFTLREAELRIGANKCPERGCQCVGRHVRGLAL